ncbi:MAG TPA: ATP-binding protein [Longimicrobiales bacterium]|nr:ATP-binding protein [Longimicrobiales bacterium]
MARVLPEIEDALRFPSPPSPSPAAEALLLEIGPEGMIRRASPRARLLLQGEEEIVGRPLVDFVSEEDRELLEAMPAGPDPAPYESLLLLRAGGASRDPACVVTEARAASSDGEGGAGIRLDCRPAGPRDVREARVLRAARYEIVGQIASGVAHELNNVLSTVTTFADLLLARAPAGSSEAEDLAEIKSAALETSAVTRKLDLFAGGRAKGPREVHVDEILRGLQKLVRRFVAAETAVSLDVADDSPAVRVDPLRLEEALMALVANARDAMPDGGTLTLRTRRTDAPSEDDSRTWLRIEVHDTGAGPSIPVEEASAPFASTAALDRGTGLGLATVRRLAAAMGGRFGLDARQGGGAVAWIDLPGLDLEGEAGVWGSA